LPDVPDMRNSDRRCDAPQGGAMNGGHAALRPEVRSAAGRSNERWTCGTPTGGATRRREERWSIDAACCKLGGHMTVVSVRCSAYSARLR
jgi:hypothetical protein